MSLLDPPALLLKPFAKKVLGRNETPAVADTAAFRSSVGVMDDASIMFRDDFRGKPDTSLGSLGVPDSGGASWELLQSGAILAATEGQIQNGGFRSAIGAVTYAVRELPEVPTKIGAIIRFEDGNASGAPREAAFAIALGTKETGSWITSFVHLTVTKTNATIQTGFYPQGAAQVLRTHRVISFEPPLAKGVDYEYEAEIQGDTVTIRVGDKTMSATSVDLSRYWGRYVYWEHFYNVGITQSSDSLAIFSVWAKRALRPSTRMPAIAQKRGVMFAGGADRGSAQLLAAGCTSIGTGDYSVVWIGKIPDTVTQARITTNSINGLWLLSQNASGTNNGTGTVLELRIDQSIGDGKSATLDLWLPQGANFIKYTYKNHPVIQAMAGQVVCLTHTRRGLDSRLYVNGVYVPPFSVSNDGATQWSAAITSDNFYIGTSASTRGYCEEVLFAGICNFALTDAEVDELTRYGLPYRYRGSKNVELATGTVVVGKVYRITAVQTNHFFTNNVAGDRIQILSTTLLRNLNTGVEHTMISGVIDASNKVIPDGFLCWLDGTVGHGGRMWDRSTNKVDGLLSGNAVFIEPPIADIFTQLKSWTTGESYEILSMVTPRDSDGVLTQANVKWPDGTVGVFTTTTKNTTFLTIDAYTITYAGTPALTVTQTAVGLTRDSNGAITAKAALTVA